MSETAQVMQGDLFGPPEIVAESYRHARGRQDDKPAPWERQLLWPAELAAMLGADALETLYGDVPRRTRLSVKEVCRILRCDSNHVYRLIDCGSLDAADIANPASSRPLYRVYRYSVVKFLFNRERYSRSMLPDTQQDEGRRQ